MVNINLIIDSYKDSFNFLYKEKNFKKTIPTIFSIFLLYIVSFSIFIFLFFFVLGFPLSNIIFLFQHNHYSQNDIFETISISNFLLSSITFLFLLFLFYILSVIISIFFITNLYDIYRNKKINIIDKFKFSVFPGLKFCLFYLLFLILIFCIQLIISIINIMLAFIPLLGILLIFLISLISTLITSSFSLIYTYKFTLDGFKLIQTFNDSFLILKNNFLTILSFSLSKILISFLFLILFFIFVGIFSFIFSNFLDFIFILMIIFIFASILLIILSPYLTMVDIFFFVDIFNLKENEDFKIIYKSQEVKEKKEKKSTRYDDLEKDSPFR